MKVTPLARRILSDINWSKIFNAIADRHRETGRSENLFETLELFYSLGITNTGFQDATVGIGRVIAAITPKERIQLAQWLLDSAGEHVNLEELLWDAVANNDLGLTRHLLDVDADLHARSVGMRILDFAERSNVDQDMIDFLVNKGAGQA